MQWYFTKDELANTPSRKSGIDADKELMYRQHAANFIQDMGQRLSVSQLCINTAIVYMHRFYVFHSLTRFHRNSIAVAAIFLAAKVEEQPRKLEHVIRVAHMCLHRDTPLLDPKSEVSIAFERQYLEQAQDLVFNENVLLQTLGFDVAIDHPHTHVVRCCQLVKASKDLAQTSYFMASNSLHLTTMCLQYQPTVVACFCIHLAMKWAQLAIPQSNEGKEWFYYVDKSVTSELINRLTEEFLHIFDKCPSRLKKKIMQQQETANKSPNMSHPAIANSPFDAEPRKVQTDVNDGSTLNFGLRPDSESSNKKLNSTSGRPHIEYREFREKRERERLEREKASASNSDPNKHHSNHHKPSSSTNLSNKHSSSSAAGMKPSAHNNNHHSSRADMKSFSQFMSQHQQQQQLQQQRHSSSTTTSSSNNHQSRDRQRISREHYSHGQHNDKSLDSSVNNYSQESSTVYPTEKLNPYVNKLPNDQKLSKQQQRNVKPYAKHTDPASMRSLKKPENRYEDVKKTVEKPAPPPKPRPEIIQEEFASMMLKQSHHTSKYNHPQPPHPPVTAVASLPSTTQHPHKMQQMSAKSNQMQSVKNGGSLSSLGHLNNMISDKRQKSPILPPAPPAKHRSLFSPEKSISPIKESLHSMQRIKQKSKSSAALPKSQEFVFSSSNSLPTIADSTLNKQKLPNNSMDATAQKRTSSSLEFGIDHDNKPQHHQMDNNLRKFSYNFGKQEIQGSNGNQIPDMTQPSKDIKNISPNFNEIKSIEGGKSLDITDSMMSTNNQRHKQQHHTLSNGLDSNLKQEYSTVDINLDFIVKPELPDDILSSDMPTDLLFIKPEPNVNDILSFSETSMKSEKRNDVELISSKPDSFSPMKSAQSISALLQEPLAPMPSLLLNIPDYDQQQGSSEKNDNNFMRSHHQVSTEPSLPSTVDMSALAPSNCVNEMSLQVPSTSITVPPGSTDIAQLAVPDERKSDHRIKSEKKKKKEKHKHKDKDRSKEKHKNKHKEKDRHREKSENDNKTEKNSGSSNYASSGPTGPIIITIPRDKINLSSETAPTKLKITLPKQRYKDSDVSSQPAITTQTSSVAPQTSLKIKIRKDSLPRNTGAVPHSSSQQESSRKRERAGFIDESLSAPPTKKQSQFQYHQQQQQRPNENQNGRHNSYNSGSNNKGDRMTHT